MEPISAAGLMGWTIDETGIWSVYLYIDGELIVVVGTLSRVSWFDPIPPDLQYREMSVIR